MNKKLKQNKAMKKIFVLALAAAAMVSCSNNDLLEVNQEAIDFGGPFVENATRATDNTYGTVPLDNFQVYGTVQGSGADVVNIYNGADVTMGTKTYGEAWTCDVKQYWIEGATYDFAAVAEADVVGQDANKMPTTLTYNTADQKDLIYASATATGKASGNELVKFTFNHLLSKAFFTVTSNTQDGYYHNVKDITVSNYKTGVYTIAAGTWAPGTEGDISFGDVDNVTSDDTDGKTNATQMLLIPTTKDFNVTFTVEIYKDDTLIGTKDYTRTVTQDLVKGNAYNFTLALTVGEEIQFTVTGAPAWGGTTDVDVL